MAGPPPAPPRIEGGAAAIRAPVVVVVLDELPLWALLDPDRRIDARLFPSFARLAARSVWFRNATAQETLTTRAVPILFTGRRLGSWNADRSPENLLTWLAGTHRVIVNEAVTQLCPASQCEQLTRDRGAEASVLVRDVGILWAHWALPPSVTRALPPVDANWADFANRKSPREREALVRSFISALGDTARPTAWVLHVLLPHVPWMGLPSDRVYPAHFSRVVGMRPPDRWLATVALQRHLLQVGYVDRLLGALLDRLEETGLFERALVVVTSDHGVAFQPGHHRRTLDDATLHDVLRVPLFVKLPRQRRGRVSDRNVESIDLLPTIAGALGARLPFRVDGRSALDPRTPARPRKRASSNGRAWTLPATLPRSWPGLQRKLALLGRVPTWEDVWAIDAAPALRGRAVDPAALPPYPGVGYRLLDAAAVATITPGARSVPSYVRGIVWAATRAALPETVAVVLDGAIAGSSHVFDRRDKTVFLSQVMDRRATGAFALMVPERLLTPGAHRIEAVAVDGAGRLARLEPGEPPPASALVAVWPDT